MLRCERRRLDANAQVGDRIVMQHIVLVLIDAPAPVS
jgi:hypothetical protein